MKVRVERLPSGDIEIDFSLTAFESLDIPGKYLSAPGGCIAKTDFECRELAEIVSKAAKAGG